MKPETEWDYWRRIYTANPRLMNLMSFECFIQAPEQYLFSYTFGTAQPLVDADYYPLLPRQRIVKERLIIQDAAARMGEAIEEEHMRHTECCLRNNAYLQPLKHHSYRVSNDRGVSHG